MPDSIEPQYCDVPDCHNLATAVVFRGRVRDTWDSEVSLEVWLCDYHDAQMRGAEITRGRG